MHSNYKCLKEYFSGRIISFNAASSQCRWNPDPASLEKKKILQSFSFTSLTCKIFPLEVTTHFLWLVKTIIGNRQLVYLWVTVIRNMLKSLLLVFLPGDRWAFLNFSQPLWESWLNVDSRKFFTFWVWIWCLCMCLLKYAWEIALAVSLGWTVSVNKCMNLWPSAYMMSVCVAWQWGPFWLVSRKH